MEELVVSLDTPAVPVGAGGGRRLGVLARGRRRGSFDVAGRLALRLSLTRSALPRGIAVDARATDAIDDATGNITTPVDWRAVDWRPAHWCAIERRVISRRAFSPPHHP